MSDLFNQLNEVIGEGLLDSMNINKKEKPVDIEYVRRALAHQVYEHEESMEFAGTGPSMYTFHEGCVYGFKTALKYLGVEDEN